MTMVRAGVALALLIATAAIAQSARAHTAVGVPPPSALPIVIDDWHGEDAGALDPETVRILAADSYVNRTYTSGGTPPVGLYIAYYAQQRPGVSIHSPLHCLPGNGWEPIDVATRRIDGESASLRRLIVQKARDRAVVLYWYAVHGRMLGDEMLSKAWLLHDSLRYRRSDAALVRVVVPIAGSPGSSGSADAAEREGLSFARALLPYVSRLWS
jgi:EpsI family protein